MLYDLVGEAESDLVYEASATILEAATQWRVTKVQEKETFDKNDNPRTETTTTTEGPSLTAALKIVETFGKRWRNKNGAQHPRDQSGRAGSDADSDFNELDSVIKRTGSASTKSQDEKG